MFPEIYSWWVGIKIGESILYLVVLGITLMIVLIKKVIEDRNDKRRHHWQAPPKNQDLNFEIKSISSFRWECHKEMGTEIPELKRIEK